MNENTVTSNLEEFGLIERIEFIRIFNAWGIQGLPIGFDAHEVHIAFNKDSGNVFLSNSSYQCAMLDDEGVLAEWYHCSECGHEGFCEDCKITDIGCNQCSHDEPMIS